MSGTLLISLLLYDAAIESRPFFNTSSPGGTYTVNLTGRKERPYFFTNTVNYHVLKNGKPFLPSRYLHSGDFLDISFELAYPNHRWVNENVVQLYREQYLNEGKPDALTVVNKTDKTIKYLEVVSVDKFLFFDMQPGDVVNLLNSQPRGDYKSFYVSGEFVDGRSVGGSWATTRPDRESAVPSTYYISINVDGATFESPR